MRCEGRPNPGISLGDPTFVSTVRNNLGLQQSREQRFRLDASVAAARALLGSDAQSVWTAGERMPVEKAISYALVEIMNQHCGHHRYGNNNSYSHAD